MEGMGSVSMGNGHELIIMPVPGSGAPHEPGSLEPSGSAECTTTTPKPLVAEGHWNSAPCGAQKHSTKCPAVAHTGTAAYAGNAGALAESTVKHIMFAGAGDRGLHCEHTTSHAARILTAATVPSNSLRTQPVRELRKLVV